MRFVQAERFDDWRETARELLCAEVPPAEVHWSAESDSLLFADELAPAAPKTIHVPPQFVALAKDVAFHRDSRRWEILYRLLWRLTHGERQLLEISTDDDVHAATQMQKAVKRDEHKMHAFVRFRRVLEGENESYVAWHRPDHLIVRLAAPFFARRFSAMQWSILTPDESVHWDGHELRYSPGVPATMAPQQDALDELWRTYYAHIFNPARVNVAQMKKEMPVRHWATLPEAQLIPELIAQAESRVRTMIDTREGFATSAQQFIPAQYDLSSLAAAAHNCTACDLHCHATQTVFGRGPATARIVLVGEQPGNQEDQQGQPFVGPAGQLLEETLTQAGLQRSELYLTNVVKHFKFILRGKRRLHQKPGSREIAACQPWLAAELKVLQPELLVCLGSTAAQAIFGRGFRLTSDRGKLITTQFAPRTLATWHPAAILRMTNEIRQQEMREQLVRDLTISAAMLA
ncbi:UdgX family uracil-DNA binding protein [Anatilimnocola floriformis]|uniref:UdgX family uracil-DNA binding protein n=1 Tax=Anatilimnocola floriformis TaxID=2948575 RepID=UPI0020C3F144|nr:UdgX family uracil-DNA binding protein [Anatilimnocola floriformis]